MKTNMILLLFALVSCVQIFACIPPVRLRLRYATKPMLMPLLALWVLFSLEPAPKGIVLGLLCGFAGDLLLLASKRKSIFFVVGSTFFAAGHVLYAVYFWTHLGGAPSIPLLAGVGVLYVAVVFLLLRLLRPNMQKRMFFPTCAYMLVISAMSLSALAFASTNGSQWHWVVYAASCLFLFSDSCLSYDKFYKPLKYRSVIVMATYILAQAGIAIGVVKIIGGGM